MDILSEELSYLVSDLNPFTEYTFRVTASTIVGEGPSRHITEKTREQGGWSHGVNMMKKYCSICLSITLSDACVCVCFSP